MLKGERGFLVFIALALAFAALAWVAMRPAFPSLPASQFKQAEETEYSPGNPRCYPSRLQGLPEREAADERYRCETQAEKHRQQSDNLVQQTRAANAADAVVRLTYGQSLMGLAGTIFGVLTLLAAAYAAWYARHAAKAAREGLDHAREEARPWISIAAKPERITGGARAIRFYYRVEIKNVGRLVATNVYVLNKIINGSSIADNTLNSLSQEWEEEREPTHAVLMPGETTSFSLWAFRQKLDFTGKDAPLSRYYPMLVVYVMYNIPGDPEPRWSRRVFWFGMTGSRGVRELLGVESDPQTLCIDEDCLPLQAKNLVLESLGSAAH